MKLSAQALSEGFPSLISMGQMLRNGLCTSVDLTQFALRRIEELDRRLHAFVEVYASEALSAAEAADRLLQAGHWLGPLHGVPVALKDNIDVKGKVSHAGSTLLGGRIADSDAAIAHRLLQSGSVIIGKTHMVEFALGAWGTNEYMGTPRNPWGQSEHLSPGGSSSGSAVAVAAGMVPLAIGTDTGASVRVPASLCGVTGLKPTIGRLPSQGVVPLSTTLDSVGILAATAEDAALMFATLTGDETAFPKIQQAEGRSPTLRGLRVGVLADAELEGLQPEIQFAFRRALALFKEQGATLRTLSLPSALDDLADVQSTIMLSRRPRAGVTWPRTPLFEWTTQFDLASLQARSSRLSSTSMLCAAATHSRSPSRRRTGT